MQIIIEKNNDRGSVRDSEGIYEVTGYNKTLGFTVSHDTYKNGCEGKRLTKAEEDYLNRLYYTVFVTGTNEPK